MSNYLIHYGVKGMKWGVRHDPERSLPKRTKKSPYSASKKTSNYTGELFGEKYNTSLTTTSISYKNTKKNSSKNLLDKLAKSENYNDADKKFDRALTDYFKNREKGEDYANKLLHQTLKDYSYKFTISDETTNYGVKQSVMLTGKMGKNYVEKYSDASLIVYGNNYAYKTSGEKDYTDEQTFIKIKKKK